MSAPEVQNLSTNVFDLGICSRFGEILYLASYTKLNDNPELNLLIIVEYHTYHIIATYAIFPSETLKAYKNAHSNIHL